MFIFDQCVRDLELNGYALLPLPNLHPSQPQPQPQTNESRCKITCTSTSTSTTIIAQAFHTARRALNAISDNNTDEHAAALPSSLPSPSSSPLQLIDPSTDSGSWTGYHNAAVVNGRYNQYREGFVFSNGEMFDVDTASMLLPDTASMLPRRNNDDKDDGDEVRDCTFEEDMNRLFSVMHDDVAEGVLRAIERRLELPHLYFQNEVGPTRCSSQWHMKRYVIDANVQCNPSSKSDGIDVDGVGVERQAVVQVGEEESKKEAGIFLPVHTDPSLISVVILDRTGRNKGGMGLEVFHPLAATRIVGVRNNHHSTKNDDDSAVNNKHRSPPSGTWKEISHHGHDVAVVFVGSVLSYLTKGQVFSAAKHRVVNWDTTASGDRDMETIGRNNNNVDNGDNNNKPADDARMAATLFVRPHANALMKTLPSPQLQAVGSGGGTKKNPPTFCMWNARVARNYMKKKKKKKQQQQGNKS